MDQHTALGPYGWNEALARQLRTHDGALTPARVVSVHEGLSEVVTAAGKELVWNSIPPVRLRPVTGDWVGLGQQWFERSHPKQTTSRWRARPEGASPPDRRRRGVAIVLGRAAVLPRRLAGDGDTNIAIAANVDLVLVVASLANRLRMEALIRYLALAARGTISAGVVLTKVDLRRPAQEELDSLQRTLRLEEAPHLVSAVTGEGLDELEARIPPRTTSVLLGPSGAGKSTLVNWVFGQAVQPTGEVSHTGAGRHTTTASHLRLAENGCLYVDTPGVHRLGDLPAEMLDEMFDEVHELSGACRYPSCGHRSESACAVRAGVDGARLALYLSLRRRQP